MKKGFLKENRVLGINLLYILSILPLIIYGYYKNGLAVYNHGYLTFVQSLQYLVIPVIVIILSYVFEIYYYIFIKKDKDYHNVLNSIVPYINALCYLVTGPQDYLYVTIPLIVILDIILKFIDNKFSFNQIALFKCLLFCVLSIFSLYNDANLYELQKTIAPSLNNYFFGNFAGGIGATSALLSIVGYIILIANKYYKKEIPIIAILSYATASSLICLVGDLTFNQLLTNTFASSFLFITIFVAPLSVATPILKIGRIIYAIVFGILSAVVVNAFNFYIGLYFIVLVLSLIEPLLNKFKFSAD